MSTRWQASCEGWNVYPEVYAEDEASALRKAIKSFEGLCATHKRDPSARLLWPTAFDETSVTVVDIGLPLFKPVDFKVAPFPKVDVGGLYQVDFGVLDK